MTRGELEEIYKRLLSGDYLRDITLTVKQMAFFLAVWSGKFAESFFFGANRSGKSAIGCYIGARIARLGFPWAEGEPTQGWVVCLDFPMSRDLIQPYYFDNGYGVGTRPFIPDHEIEKFDRQAQTLILKTGTHIGFKSCESGVSKFQSAGIDWVHKDEVLPPDVEDEIAIRVGAGRRLIQWNTCTLLPPEGKSGDVHSLYDRVIRPWKQGETSRHVTCASIYDNPHILREEIERLESRYPVGSMSRRIRLDGELLPGISGSLVYTGFSVPTHVVRGLELDPSLPVLWTWDFNVAPLTSTICQRKPKRIEAIDEIYMDEGSLDEMCDIFMERVPPNHQITIYGDATGKNRSHQSRMTSYQIIMGALTNKGYRVKLSVPEVNPSETDRINAVNTAFSGVSGVSKVAISPKCEELIKDLESVVYDRHNKIKKISLASDPYQKRTHTSDNFGYLVAREMPVVYVSGPARETKIREMAYSRRRAADWNTT